MLSDEAPISELDEFRGLIAEGQERGFLTFEQIAACLEEFEVTKEQVQELHSYLDEQGIEVVESDGKLARSELGSVEARAAGVADPDVDPDGGRGRGVQSLGDVFSLVETAEAAAEAARRARNAQQGQAVHPQRSRPAGQDGYLAQAAGRTGGMGGASPPIGSPAWRRLVLGQGKIFAGRYVRLIGRDRPALAFSLLQGIAVALLTWLAVPKPFHWAASSAPMFVFGCAAVWFGMIGAVRELVKEKVIWRREYLAGGSMPAYLASKVVVLGAMGAIQAATLTLVVWKTLGLPGGGPFGKPFVTIFITVWLGALAGMALGLGVSAASESADRAMSLVPYLLITQLVLCGVLFPLGGVKFISYIMPARWSVSGLGGIAGLNAGLLHQTAGLYPHSAIGLIGNWVMLLVLTAAGLAIAVRRLYRQGRGWSVGRG